MGTLAERLDALLEGLADEDVDGEIERCESRLTVLQSLKKRRQEAPPAPSVRPRGRPLKVSKGVNGTAAVPVKSQDDLARSIGIFLKEEGPKRIDAIRNHLGAVSMSALDAVLEKSWFERDHGLWKLSNEGWVHFKE